MEQEHQFIDYIEQSIIKNWDKDALTDYKGITPFLTEGCPSVMTCGISHRFQ